MLHLKKLLDAKPKEHETAELKQLTTPWGDMLDPEHVLEEHPTPQFARKRFRSLNGTWSCAFAAGGHAPTDDLELIVREASAPDAHTFSQEIVVPFSPEASLSGVGRSLQPEELLWYRRMFDAPELANGERLLLHFQAVDFACAVYVNGQRVGTHVGGYLPFAFDVTDVLAADAQAEGNELLVCVADPSEFGGQPRGKQRFDRGDIWYTAQSGIWQTVWLEVVPAAYIASARIEPDAETGIVTVGFHLASSACPVQAGTCMPPESCLCHPESDEESYQSQDQNPFAGTTIQLEVLDGATVVARASCEAEATCALAAYVPNVQLWSPDSPQLYTLRFTFGDDVVEGYCGFRTVEVRNDAAGHARIYLNNQPFFVRGVLDQGYWPDGLLTAPSDEALVYDIQSMRDAGFNLLRKHIKVEAARWYYHCDCLGMLVWQDMVSGGDAELNAWVYSYKPSLFKPSWSLMRDTTVSNQRKLGAASSRYRNEWMRTCLGTVEELVGHPCIIAWTLFNEGWGQFDSAAACDAVRAADPSRPICATSGWYDQGAGDIRGVHNYFRDFAVWKRGLRGRAFVITEFGGFAHHVDGHSSLDEVYGYEIYDTEEEWRVRTGALLAEVEVLEERGLAGFVLTQLSDIEEETNGILTYDRRVNKWA